jgi:hypothetical protein
MNTPNDDDLKTMRHTGHTIGLTDSLLTMHLFSMTLLHECLMVMKGQHARADVASHHLRFHRALHNEIGQPIPRLAPEVVADRLGEWRRLLRSLIVQSRAVLQRVLRERITFTPNGKGYTFKADTRFDKLFSGCYVPRPSFIPAGGRVISARRTRSMRTTAAYWRRMRVRGSAPGWTRTSYPQLRSRASPTRDGVRGQYRACLWHSCSRRIPRAPVQPEGVPKTSGSSVRLRGWQRPYETVDEAFDLFESPYCACCRAFQ